MPPAAKAACDEFNALTKSVSDQLPENRYLSMLGAIEDLDVIKSLDDVLKQVQFVTISDSDAKYAERFVTAFMRIGDDIEHEGQMDELIEELEHPDPKKGEDDDEGGMGFRCMNTRHSAMQVAVLDYGALRP